MKNQKKVKLETHEEEYTQIKNKKVKVKYIIILIFILIIFVAIKMGIYIATWQNLAQDMISNTSSTVLDTNRKYNC